MDSKQIDYFEHLTRFWRHYQEKAKVSRAAGYGKKKTSPHPTPEIRKVADVKMKAREKERQRTFHDSPGLWKIPTAKVEIIVGNPGKQSYTAAAKDPGVRGTTSNF